MNTTSHRSGLLAVAVAFSAGIHAALVPEHLREMPPLGDAFIAAAAVGALLAIGLVVRPDDQRIPTFAGLFCLGQIAAWALFVSVRVPGFSGTPETIETIALVSKAVEAFGVVLAFRLSSPTTRGMRVPLPARRLQAPSGPSIATAGRVTRAVLPSGNP